MKPQDVVFMLILAVLLWKRDPKYLVIAGLVSLVFSIPLFQFWVFFTAERLVMYASAFLLGAIILLGFKLRN